MKQCSKNLIKLGFTLLEIMIVVLILGILLSVAIPNLINARNTSRSRTCVVNLREIDAAKEVWAMSFNKVAGDVPLLADLVPYLKGGNMPTCPESGTYNPNSVGANPTCSAGGQHILP